MIDGFPTNDTLLAVEFETLFGAPAAIIHLTSPSRNEESDAFDDVSADFFDFYSEAVSVVSATPESDDNYAKFKEALIGRDALAHALNVVIAVENGAYSPDASLLCSHIADSFNLKHVRIGDINRVSHALVGRVKSLLAPAHDAEPVRKLGDILDADAQRLDEIASLRQSVEDKQRLAESWEAEAGALAGVYEDMLRVVQEQRGAAEAAERAFRKEREELVVRIAELETLTSGQPTTAGKVESENALLKEAVEQMRLELQSVKDTHAVEKETLQSKMDEHVQTREAEQNSFQAKIAAQASYASDLDSRQEELESELNQVKAALASRVDKELLAEVESQHREQVAALDAALSAVQQERDELSRKVDIVTATHDDRVKSHAADLGFLKAEQEALEAANKDLRDSRAAMETEAASTKTALDALKTTHSSLAESHAAHENTIATLHTSLSAARELAEAQPSVEQVLQFETDIKMLRSQLDVQQRKFDVACKEYEANMAAAELLPVELQKKVGELTRALDGFEREKQEEHAALVTENKAMQVSLEAVKAEHAAEVAGLVCKLDSAAAELEQSHKEARELTIKHEALILTHHETGIDLKRIQAEAGAVGVKHEKIAGELVDVSLKYAALNEEHIGLVNANKELDESFKKFRNEVDVLKASFEAQAAQLSAELAQTKEEKRVAVQSWTETETKYRIECQKVVEMEQLIGLMKQQVAHLYEKSRRSRVHELEDEIVKRDQMIASFQAEVKFLKSFMRSATK
ncbi:hypothetical protein BC830DRAFT_1220849 [Chytriomyces sp. MP71]|nr:hypothetical protein BC830DRAFT_1220849 [Chytriomyces sp. MP71]